MDTVKNIATIAAIIGMLTLVGAAIYCNLNKELKKISLSKSAITIIGMGIVISMVNIVVSTALFFNTNSDLIVAAVLLPICNLIVAICVIWEQRSHLPKKSK